RFRLLYLPSRLFCQEEQRDLLTLCPTLPKRSPVLPGRARGESMKPWHIGSTAALALASVIGGGMVQPVVRAQGAPTWMTDYEAARGTARRSDKPLFVAFR